MSSLENVRPGIKPRFLSQKMAQKLSCGTAWYRQKLSAFAGNTAQHETRLARHDLRRLHLSGARLHAEMPNCKHRRSRLMQSQGDIKEERDY